MIKLQRSQFIEKEAFFTALENLAIITNSKEKEVLTKFLAEENKGIFKIGQFFTKESNKKEANSNLPKKLLSFLNEIANFLEKSKGILYF